MVKVESSGAGRGLSLFLVVTVSIEPEVVTPPRSYVSLMKVLACFRDSNEDIVVVHARSFRLFRRLFSVLRFSSPSFARAGCCIHAMCLSLVPSGGNDRVPFYWHQERERELWASDEKSSRCCRSDEQTSKSRQASEPKDRKS
jgi:hypothetical protein